MLHNCRRKSRIFEVVPPVDFFPWNSIFGCILILSPSKPPPSALTQNEAGKAGCQGSDIKGKSPGQSSSRTIRLPDCRHRKTVLASLFMPLSVCRQTRSIIVTLVFPWMPSPLVTGYGREICSMGWGHRPSGHDAPPRRTVREVPKGGHSSDHAAWRTCSGAADRQ